MSRKLLIEKFRDYEVRFPIAARDELEMSEGKEIVFNNKSWLVQ